MSEVRCVAPAGDRVGEAATWSPDEGALYWCDVNRFLIHRLEADESVRSWFFDEPVTALALTSDPGRMLVALGSKLILWRPDTDAREDYGFRLDDHPTARLNDGRAGPNGDFWVGSMFNNVGPRGEALEARRGHGRLFRLSPDRQSSQQKDDLGISNTVDWSPDHRTFYFGDTMRNVIWAYDYDEASGAISNERPFFEGFERGVPDGSVVDSEGFLWNCRFGGSCVVRVSPVGQVDRMVEMPVRNITTAAFGGEDLRTLYITTATILTDDSDRLAGSLFALRTETPGLLSHRVALG
jgi:sugar lactone lactonase YvrE